ncbi:MAG: hypothetical protein L0Y71_25350 [Gemmataceae bacterium]|nr:hypothetical protein [Gemmataceae bacterium]
MILFYTIVLLLFGITHWLIQRRAAALGRAYSVLADKVLKALHGPRKPGNAAYDACAIAKQQFELGGLVSRRDRAEAKHYAWQSWADWFGKATNAVRNWKGQKLPYTLGVLDVWIVLYLIDHFGFGDVIQPRQVVETVVAWFTG